MNTMLVAAGRRGTANVAREGVPSCRCTRRTTYGRPERECICCQGCGAFAECEHCMTEVLTGEVYRVSCGEHEYIACGPACVGAILVEALESAAGIS